PVPAEVYERAHTLGLTGAAGEQRVRVPTWSRSSPSQSFQVDHAIELQVTPDAWRDQFDNMFNYELLDQGANSRAGPRLKGAINAERAIQVAFDPSAATRVLIFDDVQLGDGTPGERWLPEEIQSGEQLD